MSDIDYAVEKRKYYSDPAGVVVEERFEDEKWETVIGEPEWYPTAEYRVFDKYLVIGGVHVPHPLREMPPLGTMCWIPSPSSQWELEYFNIENSYRDVRALESGILHLDDTSARVHSAAIILASGGMISPAILKVLQTSEKNWLTNRGTE